MESHSSDPSPIKLDWVICRDKISFLSHFDSWKLGLETAFNKKISESLLKRYFFDTPSGPPIIILGLRDESVVASSTLVPLSLTDPVNFSTQSYLQYVAAFVLPRFSEGFQTYRDMLKLVRAELDGARYQFILSYPNKNAKNLMLRLGGFKHLDAGFFIRGKMDARISERLSAELAKPFFDDTLLEWRLHSRLSHEMGLISRVFDGENNLLDVTSAAFRKDFEGVMPWWESWGPPPYLPTDESRLDLCVYATTHLPSIKRSFLLSDIF
jgi:hypothetical protein